jgi:hypothetical protein
MEALKVRRALIPIINDISPAAVTTTADVNQRNFATLINAMTEMKMPGKAKALLHQAATIAINSFSDDDPRQASGAPAASSQPQQQAQPHYTSRRDRLLREPVSPGFHTEASDNFGNQLKLAPKEIPQAFKVLFNYGGFVPISASAAPEFRWRDVTQFLNDSKEKMNSIMLYQEFLEAK